MKCFFNLEKNSRTYTEDYVEDEMTDNDAESSHSHAFSVNSSG